MNKFNRDNRTLKVSFPLGLLIEGPQLLDPNNTETVLEYYLLENLACGLVRDQKKSPLGYEGCLAESFYQEDPRTWIFKLRSLKWSDGSNVLEHEILGWMDNLRKQDKRHVQYLKLAESINYDHGTRILKIQFPFPVGTLLLHELSLADSSLFPTDFLTSGWGKTIGPYFVKEWNKSKNALLLSANPHSAWLRQDMPHTVSLLPVPDKETRVSLFKSIDIDVVMIPSISNMPGNPELIANAPQVFTSYPTTIAYFYFNKENTDTDSLENRQKFAAIISEIRDLLKVDFAGHIGTHRDIDQMIPEGFDGRLNDLPKITHPTTHSLKKIRLLLPPVFSQWGTFCSKIVTVFANHKIDADIIFDDTGTLTKNDFAALYPFQGNQTNASGSWSFLAAPPSGKLSPWMIDFKNEYDLAFSLKDFDKKDQNFRSLHDTVLKKFIAIPFVVGETRYLLSARVDPSWWNKFDARMRFYELLWK